MHLWQIVNHSYVISFDAWQPIMQVQRPKDDNLIIMHFAPTLKLLQIFLNYPKVFKRPYTHAINDTKPKATNSVMHSTLFLVVFWVYVYYFRQGRHKTQRTVTHLLNTCAKMRARLFFNNIECLESLWNSFSWYKINIILLDL